MLVTRRQLLNRLSALLAGSVVGALGACGARAQPPSAGGSASPGRGAATPRTPGTVGTPGFSVPSMVASPTVIAAPTWTALPPGGAPVLLATLPAIGADHVYMKVAFAVDGRYLVVGTWRALALYRLLLHPTPRLEPLLERASGIIRGAAFSPDGTLVAVSYDDHIDLWETEPLRLRATLRTTRTPYTEFTGILAFSVAGDRLAADHGGYELFTWRTADGAEEVVIPRDVNPSPTLAFARGSRALLTVEPGWTPKHLTRPRGLEIWDLATKERERYMPLPEPEGVLHPSGELVAWRVGGFTGQRVAVWAPFGGGDPLLCAPYGDAVPRRAVPFPWLSFTQAGDYLAGGAYDAVYVWRVADGALVHRIASAQREPPDSTAVFGVAYLPEQRIILAQFADGGLRVWHAS